MRDDEPSTAYQLTPPADFHATVDLLGDDYLIVDLGRMLVIFRNAVLNLEVEEGDLKSAEQVVIDVLDSPPHLAETQNTLVELFLEQVETTTETAWAEVHNI